MQLTLSTRRRLCERVAYCVIIFTEPIDAQSGSTSERRYLLTLSQPPHVNWGLGGPPWEKASS